MKKTISVFAILILIFTTLSGCNFEKIEKEINDAVNDLAEISGIYGETVEFVIEESVKVEPAAIPTDTSSSYFCFRKLNSEQKRLYRLILTAVQQMTDGFIDLGSCKQTYNTDISIAYQAVSNDHPELFWMPYSYLINNKGSKTKPRAMIALSYTGNKHSCSWLINKSEKEYMTTVLNDTVNELVSNASGLSRYEAELYFHDEICYTTTYTTGDPEDLVYTAYGALINGRAVCEGYSRAMQLLCQKVGIPCTLISGECEGTGHLWNLIDPGDGWYHLDVTWDDNDETNQPYRLYFNLTTEEILNDRTIAPNILELSAGEKAEGNYNLITDECIKNNYNFFIYEGLYFDSSYETVVSARIYEADKTGLKELTFRFTDNNIWADFEKKYQSYVTKIQKMLNRSSSRATITNISIVKNTVTFYW
ncbi:MAG: hypothetical protein E7562_03700 [Ruminococcaceae bacterium]|nr:hypothetical protein [Oscillospiraceae bacterium]